MCGRSLTLKTNKRRLVHMMQKKLGLQKNVVKEGIITFVRDGKEYTIAIDNWRFEYDIDWAANPFGYDANCSFNQGNVNVTLEGRLIDDSLCDNILNNERKTIMPLREDIHNADLDDDTQLLREAGIENDSGYITEDGTEILIDILYKENRSKVVEAVKKAQNDS